MPLICEENLNYCYFPPSLLGVGNFSYQKYIVGMHYEDYKTYNSEVYDELLWEKFISGDSMASETIYRQSYSLLFSYGYRMIADKELVSDAIQSFFVKLLTNRNKLPHTKRVKAYLLSGFRNQLLDYLEVTSRMRCISLEEEAFSITEDFMTSLFDKDDRAMWQEKRLAQAIAQLSARQREILYLYYIKELSHRDIATILSMNMQSSKNLLSRTLAQLRQYCLSVATILFFQGFMHSLNRCFIVDCQHYL